MDIVSKGEAAADLAEAVFGESEYRYSLTVVALHDRVAEQAAEIERLRDRLRETCRILVDAVGADGPCDAEDAARKAVAEIERLRETRVPWAEIRKDLCIARSEPCVWRGCLDQPAARWIWCEKHVAEARELGCLDGVGP